MTKFERFREKVMEYFVVPIIVSLILCMANFVVLAFFQIEAMWLIYLTAVAFALLGVYAVVFIVCFIVDKVEEYKEEKQRKVRK